MPAPRQTPSQTVGPFFGVGLTSQPQNVLANDRTGGERVRIEGAVFDGGGQPVVDALVEIWQADAQGRYGHPDFFGFGRCPTDANGGFHFDTVKPGAVHDGEERRHAPHISVTVFARGMLVHAFTRVYFAGDPLDTDPTLALVDAMRRSTLVAERTSDSGGRVVYRWDIHLQGERETVFFDA
jgi:protocatechuate 3,4-dioxygenase alpha subunit